MNLDIFDGMEGKLTQAHIDKGVRDMCKECPVALCISDMLARHGTEVSEVMVEVGVKRVRFHTGDFEAPFLVAELDIALKVWIADFDEGLAVSTGKVYISKDGLTEDVAGNTVQRWLCGIAVD